MGITTAAVVATTYGTITCRLVVLTFATTIGNSFEEHFAPDHQYQQQQTYTETKDSTSENAGQTFNVLNNAVGLFQWLRPVMLSDSSATTTTPAQSQQYYDWTKGSCTGYQQTMLNALTNDEENPFLTIGRILAITALLLSCGLFVLWVWSTACLALTNRFQGGLFMSLALLGVIGTAGSVGCVMTSSLCSSESKIFAKPPHCQIDQGGLVMLGASLLWLCTAIIAACYVLPWISMINLKPQLPESHPHSRVWQSPHSTTCLDRNAMTSTRSSKNDSTLRVSTEMNLSKRFHKRRNDLRDSMANTRVNVDDREDNITEVYLSDFVSDRLDRIEKLVDCDD